MGTVRRFVVIGAIAVGLSFVGGAAAAGQGHAYAYGHNRVAVCHVNGDGTTETKYVAEPAVDAHIAHGDTAGECAVEPTV